MKKLISLSLAALFIAAALTTSISAKYTPPTVADTLNLIKSLLNGTEDLHTDINDDGVYNLKDVICSIRQVFVGSSMPESNNKLFDAKSDIGIYNYCPSVIELDDGTRYVYYCTNQTSYRVVDYVGCRKGTLNADGTYTWSSEKVVLSPSDNLWDAMHTCDPSVIKGSFTYNGTEYAYLMAYLGCTSTDNQENKVGLAVSNSPDGEFIRVGETPIVDFTKDSSSTVFQWGVGQPSIVSIDKAGKVWLFYTRGDLNGTRTVVRECDFSNLNAPVLGNEVKVATTNLVELDGDKDIINNADFAYDSATNKFYAASDCHPNPTNEPNYIPSHFRVTSFKGTDFAKATWKYLATIGPDDTSFARNHNVGLVRDEYGHMPSRGYLTVYYTVSNEGSTSLWSYRLYDQQIVK
ncbi:MAG: hypothetical protein IJA60_02420 [Clostridia bacterium]|nr:hypothetical protein [Clostridia bacterium]